MYDKHCWKQVESKQYQTINPDSTNSRRIKTISVSAKLKQDGKINDDFLMRLDTITLDDLIALKLESASKSIGGLLFGFELFDNLAEIAKSAVAKYVYSVAPTRSSIWTFLGLSPSRFKYLERKYQLKKYFLKLPTLQDFYVEKAYQERVKRLANIPKER
jgi:hypothetical protein